jgi:hypothetical protein
LEKWVKFTISRYPWMHIPTHRYNITTGIGNAKPFYRSNLKNFKQRKI